MASRSTRNKLRHQAERAAASCEKIQEHLRYLDDLANGQSQYINENLPSLVLITDNLQQLLLQFREGL
jgi:hypothetical protein